MCVGRWGTWHRQSRIQKGFLWLGTEGLNDPLCTDCFFLWEMLLSHTFHRWVHMRPSVCWVRLQSLGCAQSLFMELGLRRESVSNRELPKILEGGEWSRWYFRNMTNLIPHYYLLFITEVWQVWCQCLLQEWLVCFAQFPSLGHICEH